MTSRNWNSPKPIIFPGRRSSRGSPAFAKNCAQRSCANLPDMKPNLLNDVLCEGSYAGFREELLEQIAAEARRKRFNYASRWLAAAAAAIVILFILNRAPQPQQS